MFEFGKFLINYSNEWYHMLSRVEVPFFTTLEPILATYKFFNVFNTIIVQSAKKKIPGGSELR